MESQAASFYDARLRVWGRLPAVLLVSVTFVRNALMGAVGLGEDWVAPACVEVRRRSNGGLVSRIPAGSGYYAQIDVLASVQQCLASSSREAFLEAWRLSEV